MRPSTLRNAALLIGALGSWACGRDPGSCAPVLVVDTAGGVAELRSREPLAIRLTASDRAAARGKLHPLRVVLLRDGNEMATLLDSAQAEDPSTGRLGASTVSFVASDIPGVAPGAHTLRATLGCPSDMSNAPAATAEASLHVVRLGATSVGVGGAGRMPLMYHAVAGMAQNYFPVSSVPYTTSLAVAAGEPELDDPAGAPRAFPAPPDRVESPPVDASGAVLERGSSFPVSLVVGTLPELAFTIGKSAAGPDGAPIPTGLAAEGLPALRLVVDGAPPPDDGAGLGEGAVVPATLETSPVPSVARVDAALTWRFEARTGAGDWRPIPGATQLATIRFYGVLGNDLGGQPPDMPWVSVVDAVTRKVAGSTSDPAQVRALIVQHVYEEMGLTYERKNGAAAYTAYPSWGSSPPASADFSVARFDLGALLRRSRGNVVNCSDCASLVATYASMVGARLRYAIIGWSYDLNPILGIGATTPGSPFDSGLRFFGFHAVTTHDATGTVNDATLAVDGDDDPKQLPFERRLVQNLPGDEYLVRLSPGMPRNPPVYKYKDQETKIR